MARVIASRMSAEMEGEFVVFLIGMRINKPWKLHKWIPGVSRHAENAEGTRSAPGIRVSGT